MHKSQPSAATDSGNHRCTRKSAACEQGVCICRPLPQHNAPMSPSEFLFLAVKLAKERNLRTIPLPLDLAESVLDLLNNPPQESIPPVHAILPHIASPPLEITSVSFEEEQRRTRPMRPSAVYDVALKDAGRGWHRGM